MAIPQDSKEHVDLLADETLTLFEKVAVTARDSLGHASGVTVDALASINTMTSSGAVNRLAQISDENRKSYLQLATEPAIARVVVQDEDGNPHTYYICRTTPILGMASYKSPVGRLASLPVGAEFVLPSGRVEVLERALLHPASDMAGWDSVNTVIESDDYQPITIASLRALLESVPVDELSEDLLKSLLAQDSEMANIQAGIRRNLITKMELRDQPILDQYQDGIFRLPLGSRLLILGPPGTGKTTTLIRRLSQKLNSDFLSDGEQDLVKSVSANGISPHEQSWLMFTPTELLKQYVKEAFAREEVPAPEARIKTWTDYRRELGRRVLGVLKTASIGGTFVFKDSQEFISPETQGNMIAWFNDFNMWHKATFIDGLNLAAKELSQDREGNISEIGKQLPAITLNSKPETITALFTALIAESSLVQDHINDLKAVTDRKVHESLSLNVNRNKTFLNELASFIDGLQDAAIVEGDDADDLDADEEDDVTQPKTPLAKAQVAYNKAVRSQARAQARKRSQGKNTRNGKILEWLGDRTLAEKDRASVGASLLVQGRARSFVNPVKKYIDGIPKRYRTYRRLRQNEGKWYSKDALSHSHIEPLELDVVLLAMLRSGGELLNVARIVRSIDSPAWSSLKPINDLYKNQILVDEATDFSPIQLACMAALAHPRLRSFFACGDFNQRLTTWGSRSLDDMRWVVPDIETKTITVSYRQTSQLNALARELIRIGGGSDGGAILPEHVNSDGVPPVLAEDMSDQMEMVDWLTARIQEIESNLETLPSIAILVNNEDEVQSLADKLDAALSELSLRAVACPRGLVMGQGNDVRVFDVQHIKGMEFEAVFFIGIDRLAAMHPALFDKYLYVGTTRAATYLGVTCEGELPASIAAVRPMFAESW